MKYDRHNMHTINTSTAIQILLYCCIYTLKEREKQRKQRKKKKMSCPPRRRCGDVVLIDNTKQTKTRNRHKHIPIPGKTESDYCCKDTLQGTYQVLNKASNYRTLLHTGPYG